MRGLQALKNWFSRGVLVVVFGGLLAGCASKGPNEVYDPLEPVNRQIFAFNTAVDTMLIRPAAYVYRDFTPRPFKKMVGNLVDHLTLPLTIVHDLLQGKPERAQIAFSRFFINSIVGIGGLFDIATPHGLKHHEEDAGQTLAVMGSGPGPYIVLPLIGPSSLRDGTGRLIDWVIDPVSMVSYLPNEGGEIFRISRTGATVIVRREALIEPLDALSQSLDYYAAVRAAYGQRRHADIHDGNPPPVQMGKDPFADAEKASQAR